MERGGKDVWTSVSAMGYSMAPHQILIEEGPPHHYRKFHAAQFSFNYTGGPEYRPTVNTERGARNSGEALRTQTNPDSFDLLFHAQDDCASETAAHPRVCPRRVASMTRDAITQELCDANVVRPQYSPCIGI